MLSVIRIHLSKNKDKLQTQVKKPNYVTLSTERMNIKVASQVDEQVKILSNNIQIIALQPYRVFKKKGKSEKQKL